MIRGYVAVLSRDSPLPDVTRLTSSYRKVTIRLVLNDTREFYISIVGTDYFIKVPGNIRTVNSCNTASGVLRIGFISPNLDLAIYSNTEDLEVFAFTVEAVKEPTLPPPPECSDSTHKDRPSCICLVTKSTRYQCYHRGWICPMSVSSEICVFCCYNVFESYDKDDVCKIINTWKSELRLSIIPEPIVRLRNLKRLSVEVNFLKELPAALGNLKNLRDLYIQDNELKILPGWMYREETFHSLVVRGNYCNSLHPTNYCKPQLNPNDFENVRVPSLVKTVVKYIITERVAYWEYNMPHKLVDLLEAAYLCRCGSVVFPNIGGRVVQCRIKLKALTPKVYDDDDEIVIALHLCSYKCYQLIEPFMIGK